MARVLFLAHRYPYPPNKGDRIRAFHIAEHLRNAHDVSLGFLTTPGDAEPDLSWAKTFSEFYSGRISLADRVLRAGMALPMGEPASVAAFRHGGLMRWTAETIAKRRPAFIYVFSSAMAQYVPSDLPSGTKLIIDFVDVDSEKWRQYAEMQPFSRRWFYGTEARRLLSFDRAQAARALASIFVSEDEKRVFDRLSPETLTNHLAIGNGVDFAYFDPASVVGAPGAKTIVFVGHMDYWPNIDAVTWFAKDIFPLVLNKHPDARLQIVGARPAPVVSALAELTGVEVTGAVPDVRPYIGGAAVVIAPLRCARGIQNKVLEGMAMARPVVTTPSALEGINAAPGRDVLVAEAPDKFAEAVVRVLDGQAPQLGPASRAFVVKNFEWNAQLAGLDALMRT